MSHRSSHASKSRPYTASQIAKDPKKFENWSKHYRLTEGSIDDLPESLLPHVLRVFNVDRKLPKAWVTPKSPEYKEMRSRLGSDFSDFLLAAERDRPQLFNSESKGNPLSAQGRQDTVLDLVVVFRAWERLKKMTESSRQWSEADYASQVFDVLRNAAGRRSDSRSQCSVSLPQPSYNVGLAVARRYNVKTARPDGSLFIPPRKLVELWESASSPYQVLCEHTQETASGSTAGFAWQSTLCTQLRDHAKFQFASTFWEDKKPTIQNLPEAYRQNRMATTAALRQLHALGILLPIFGLNFVEFIVRAHVDWVQETPDGKVRLCSAPFPGTSTAKKTRRASVPFHEWDLTQPADIIQVYLLLRNLDRWTVREFSKLVVDGVKKLAADVKQNKRTVVPWRIRRGSAAGTKAYEGVGESISTSPRKPRRRSARVRTSRA